LKAKVSISVDSEVLSLVDKHRGIANRSAFVNYVLKIGMKSYLENQAKRRGVIPCLDATVTKTCAY
jgi:hypothetical protein